MIATYLCISLDPFYSMIVDRLDMLENKWKTYLHMKFDDKRFIYNLGPAIIDSLII